MFDRLPVLVLVPHADAGDRQAWTLDQQLRPLSDEGRAQASALADVVGVVDAVFSSPALRCVGTVEPIAARSGVEVEIDDDLRELTYVTEHEAWDAWTSDASWRSQLLAAAGPPPIARGGCFEIDPSNHRAPIRSLGTLATPPS